MTAGVLPTGQRPTLRHRPEAYATLELFNLAVVQFDADALVHHRDSDAQQPTLTSLKNLTLVAGKGAGLDADPVAGPDRRFDRHRDLTTDQVGDLGEVADQSLGVLDRLQLHHRVAGERRQPGRFVAADKGVSGEQRFVADADPAFRRSLAVRDDRTVVSDVGVAR